MKELDFDKELSKFLSRNNIIFNPKIKKYNKKFHNITKNVWIKSDEGSFNQEKNEKGYYQGVFAGFKLGPKTYDICVLCGKNLKQLRKDNPRRRFVKFCSNNHKEEYRKRRIELIKHNAKSLMWYHKIDKEIPPSRADAYLHFWKNKKEYEENRLGLESFGIKYPPWNKSMDTKSKPLTTKQRTIPEKEKKH